MKFYIIDAIALAEEIGLGSRINMIMQTAFFVISGILPKDEAVKAIKKEIDKTYGKKGTKVVEMNYAAVDTALKNIVEVPVPAKVTSKKRMKPAVPDHAPQFVKDVTAVMATGKGDTLPVSAIPADGALARGNNPVRKAQRRRPYPDMGAGSLHPVRPVFLCMSARHHQDQGIRC